MNSSNYEIITDIYKELQEEYDSLQAQIDEYQESIKEKDFYIQSFFDKEDSDFKIFSPRSAEALHREEIAEANADKNAIQKKLNKLYHDQNVIRDKKEKLEKVLRNEEGFAEHAGARNQNLSILNIQEEDRQRIARDLHDTSLQNLAHLVHKIELSNMFIDQDPLRAKLELSVISKNLKSIIEEIRNTIFDLRPMSFDDLGLRPAFEQLIEKINENNKFDTSIEIDDVSCENQIVLATIFRVVQECLVNISKHSEASNILFHCKYKEDKCIIDIQDDGIGFTKEELEGKKDKHFGLSLMKERIALLGGTITIDSKKNEGTQMHIEVPLTES